MIAKTKQSSLTRNMCQSCQIVTIHHSKHIRACYIRTLDDFLIKANFPFIFICKSKKASAESKTHLHLSTLQTSAIYTAAPFTFTFTDLPSCNKEDTKI